MFEKEIRELRKRDKVLAGIIDRVGPCTLKLHSDTYQALVEAIINQQLSMKAAATIVSRFKALCPRLRFPTPKRIVQVPESKLRQIGLSRQKVSYLKDLSEKLLAGSLKPARFPDMPDEEVIQALLQVRGVGRWTAEMFLIFSLGRPNILPVADLGFRKAVQRHYGFEALLGKSELKSLAEKWEPYCTTATWYLWQSLREDGR